MNSSSPGHALLLRWLARVTGILSICFLLELLIRIVGLRGEDGWMNDRLTARLGLLFFPVGVLVGLLLAWWREALGAAMALLSLTVFYLSQVLLVGGLPSGTMPLILTAPALLFFASWFAHRRSSNALRARRTVQKLLVVVGATVLGSILFGLGTFCYLVTTDSGSHGHNDVGGVGLAILLLTGGTVGGAIVGCAVGVCWILTRNRKASKKL